MTANTVERARGRWHEILPQLGIDARFLCNKHGTCPICGGRDRFRFDDRDGSGSYYCNQCGPGVGLILIRKLHGWDHKTACREVDNIIGNGKPAPPVATVANSAAAKAPTIQRLLHGARTQMSLPLICGGADYPLRHLCSKAIGAAPITTKTPRGSSATSPP
jgi:phage/plasmid primase-like uncharacterized protein